MSEKAEIHAKNKGNDCKAIQQFLLSPCGILGFQQLLKEVSASEILEHGHWRDINKNCFHEK